MLWAGISQWLAGPVFPDDTVRTRRATLLNTLLLIIIATRLVILAGQLLGGRTAPMVLGLNGVMLAILMGLFVLLRRGAVTFTSLALLANGFTFVTLSLALTGTLRAPLSLGFILLVILAGILFETPGLLGASTASSLAALGLVLAQNAGWLPTPDYSVTITQWIVTTAYVGFSAILVYYFLIATRRALERADQELTARRQAETAQATTEQRYQLLFERNPQPMLVFDRETLGILAVNPAAIQHYGYTEAEFQALTIRDIRPPEEVPEMIQVLSRAKPQLYQPGPVRHRRKDGTIIDVEITASEVDYANRPARLVLINDVTVRRRVENALRDSEARNHAILDALPDLLFVIDWAGTLVDWHTADSSALLIPPEQFLGRTVQQVLPEPAASQIGAMIGRVRESGGVEKAEYELSLSDGVHTFEVRGVRLNGTRALCLVRDITERVQLETALRDLNAQLEERVRQRTSDLTRINAELGRATQLKNELLAAVTHELRTPLNGILGLSEALTEGVYGDLSPDQRRTLATLTASGEHLLGLVNDLLDLSAIEAGRLELTLDAVDPELIGQACLKALQPQIDSKHLTVEWAIDQSPGLALADERRVRQMLGHLLNNAVKFTPPGGRVGLEINRELENQVVRFAVWDTGIGIPPEQQPLLFELFYQADGRLARQYGGLGLGLPLVQRLTAMHGGSLRVQTAPGQGSRFLISLPLFTAGTPMSPPLVRLNSALIIHSPEPAAEELELYLRELCPQVQVVATGHQAVETAAAKRPQVILLALLLPDLSGWEVLARLKADPRTSTIPVVITSIMDEQARGRTAGAASYLLKPITRASLNHSLDEALHNAILSPAPGSETEVGPLEAGPLVLLVEHNPIDLHHYQGLLKRAGYRVILAMNSLEAVERAREFSPAFILLDMQLAYNSGLEVLQRLRSVPQVAAAPILAMGSIILPGDEERSLAAGANAYLAKPVHSARLLERLSNPA